MKSKRKGRYALLFGTWWRHPKVAGGIHNGVPSKRLSLAARGLWASLLSHAVDVPTDGMVTLDVAELVAGGTPAKEVRAALEELRRNGLITGTDEAGEIHDFGESNITSEGWAANKERERDKKRAQRGTGSAVPPMSPGDKPGTAQGTPAGTTSGFPTGPLDSGLRTQDSGLSQRERGALARVREGGGQGPPGQAQRLPLGLAEHARTLAVAGYERRQVAPDKACRELTSPVWADIARFGRDTGALRGVTPESVILESMRVFFEDERMRSRGWPIGFLAQNGAEFFNRADHGRLMPAPAAEVRDGSG